MGTLKIFDLEKYINPTVENIFVETGTYRGDSLQFATNYKFDKLYSIELIKEFYDDCKNKFASNEKVNLINADSIKGLDIVLGELDNSQSVVFWLDAHLPHFYKSGFDTNYKSNKKILIPLEEELITIKNKRDVSNDVLIIDDLRIYEVGEFESGNWMDVINHDMYNGIEFIFELLSNTHNITKIYNHEGYILCEPKKIKS